MTSEATLQKNESDVETTRAGLRYRPNVDILETCAMNC